MTYLCTIFLLCSGSHTAKLLSVELSCPAVVLAMCLLCGTAMLTEVGRLHVMKRVQHFYREINIFFQVTIMVALYYCAYIHIQRYSCVQISISLYIHVYIHCSILEEKTFTTTLGKCIWMLHVHMYKYTCSIYM